MMSDMVSLDTFNCWQRSHRLEEIFVKNKRKHIEAEYVYLHVYSFGAVVEGMN